MKNNLFVSNNAKRFFSALVVLALACTPAMAQRGGGNGHSGSPSRSTSSSSSSSSRSSSSAPNRSSSSVSRSSSSVSRSSSSVSRSSAPSRSNASVSRSSAPMRSGSNVSSARRSEAVPASRAFPAGRGMENGNRNVVNRTPVRGNTPGDRNVSAMSSRGDAMGGNRGNGGGNKPGDGPAGRTLRTGSLGGDGAPHAVAPDRYASPVRPNAPMPPSHRPMHPAPYFHHPYYHSPVHMHLCVWDPIPVVPVYWPGFWSYCNNYWYDYHVTNTVIVTDYVRTNYNANLISYCVSGNLMYAIIDDADGNTYLKVFDSNDNLLAMQRLNRRYCKTEIDRENGGCWVFKKNDKDPMLFLYADGELLIYEAD